MNSRPAQSSPDGHDDICALVESEAAHQAAILAALPAHVALLNARGTIISVNEAWTRFSDANGVEGAHLGVGLNYLEVCDRACGDGAADGHRVADGIRSVLGGRAAEFSIEYSCDAPGQRRWFLMKASPLADAHSHGAVVMHMNVTAEKLAEEGGRIGEERFRQMAENIRDIFFLLDVATKRVLYVSPAYEEIFERSRESLYADPASWTKAIHSDDRAATLERYREGNAAGQFAYEYRIVRPDGSIRSMEARGFPVRDEAGKVVRVAGVTKDITESVQAAEHLLESKRRFTDMLDNVELLSVMVDIDGRITYCNEYMLRLTGWQCEEVLGGSFFDLFVPPAEIAALRKTFADLIAGEPRARHNENEVVTRAGERRLVRWNNSVLRSGTGEVIGSATVGEDITDQRRGETRIRRLNRVYAVLSGINTLIVRVHDRAELFREACRIAVEHGEMRIAWIGVIDPASLKLVPVASHGGHDALVDAITARCAAIEGLPPMTAHVLAHKTALVANDSQNDPRVTFPGMHADAGVRSMAMLPITVAGEVMGVMALYSDELAFFDDEEEMKLLIELANDIGFAVDHIAKQDLLAYLAYYDQVTGLANRHLFLELVTQSMRGAANLGHKLALYLIDLERFKNLNDTLGRSAGDAILRKVGAWLTANVGEASRVARVGADEFAVMLPEMTREEDAARHLEKTLDAFRTHAFRLGANDFRLGLTAGVALFPDDAADADTLLAKAEAALKKAKAQGHRYLFYTQKMTEAVAGTLSLEMRLREALDNGQFVLHYQPKMGLATGKLVGAEALIRWNDPLSGLVPPDRFIPILEETGLIYDVGRWALRQACADYLRWHAAGIGAMRVAVNVSPVQLRNPNFLSVVKEAIDADPRSAAGLELEVTESLVMEDLNAGIDTLRAIQELGVGIAIDDFGTGFSSLAYISKLPADTLKIDRSFVVEMTAGPAGLALVSTIIALAHSLELKVVAEGVETAEQSRLLKLLRCDEVQGYLFSAPLPRDAFEARFLQGDGQASGGGHG